MTESNFAPDWVTKYLTADERKTMRELAKASYSKNSLDKLTGTGWTEEDHKSHVETYTLFRKRLWQAITDGVKPGDDRAQEIAQMLADMNRRRSQGDAGIQAGMKKSWEMLGSLPDEKKPSLYKFDDEERQFIKEAMTIFHFNRTKEI